MEEGDSSLSHDSRALHAPLLRAALEDDWKSVKEFIQKDPKCLTARITEEKGTALHNAAAAKSTRFVKELVKSMKPEDLELIDSQNYTALAFAAQSEIVEIAEVMVKKNRDLPLLFPMGEIDKSPLFSAIITGHREMVLYLHSVTPIEDFTSADRIELLKATIFFTDLYDTALNILETLKLTPKEKHLLWDAMEMLARKPAWEIGSKSLPSVLWEGCLKFCFRGRVCNKALMQEASAHDQLVDSLWKQLDNNNFSSSVVPYHMKLLVEAAKVGNVAFLTRLIHSYPDLIWQTDKKQGTLFHIAIKHRQEGVFNLIYEIGVMKRSLAAKYAEGKKSMLQLAAELPSTDRLNIVSGAALQMQRELLWFQEIEKIVPKSYVNKKNREGKTPRDRFIETHEDLRKNGEKWMKDTANSCMLVATLIATMVFPAAFTVPGGNNQETGSPIFLENNLFALFFVADVVAMLFSSSSILVFLSILTSRYTEKDFLKSLPHRLTMGVATLSISIASMLIAFTAACFLVFKRKTSVPILVIAAVPAVPIILFVFLHYRLRFDIFCSTFCSNWFLFGSHNRIFKRAG